MMGGVGKRYVRHSVELNRKVWQSKKVSLLLFETEDEYYVHLGFLADTLGGVTEERLYNLVMERAKSAYVLKIDGYNARHFVRLGDLPKVLILIGWAQDRIKDAMSELNAYVNNTEPQNSKSFSGEEEEEQRKSGKRVRFPEEEEEEPSDLQGIRTELTKLRTEVGELRPLFENGAQQAYMVRDDFKAMIPTWVEQKGRAHLESIKPAIEAKAQADAKQAARMEADRIVDDAHDEARAIIAAAHKTADAERLRIAADEREKIRKENAAKFQQEDNLNFIKETYAKLTEAPAADKRKSNNNSNDLLLEKIFQ
jgi:murein DD-endopeptidase MepM/ murein hydrolase activator NlpD